jgi:hypothetical protein
MTLFEALNGMTEDEMKAMARNQKIMIGGLFEALGRSSKLPSIEDHPEGFAGAPVPPPLTDEDIDSMYEIAQSPREAYRNAH